MSEILVKAEGVSKKFCRSLKKSLWYGMQDLGRELSSRGRGVTSDLRPDEFWAVKDINFELRRGECLGLIGHNGAGKTTLLRMLNGLIKPDQGRIEIRGRVGALIALGAGFNPILSGRENIYVNASVLGLRKREIDKKIDEIVDFAEIDEFIDAPVQNYSSGMQVRLGFAVATTIESEVVLLDEVLAVGDASFRAKCYKRISLLLNRSAVILVSHNMDHISQICSSAITMSSGRCICVGDVNKCVDSYYKSGHAPNIKQDVNEYIAAEIALIKKSNNNIVKYGECASFDLSLLLKKSISIADVKITIFTESGSVVAESYTRSFGKSLLLDEGVVNLSIKIGPVYVKSGKYTASLVVLNRDNNEHLYWGSRVFDFIMTGPGLGSVVSILPMTLSINDIK